MLTTKTTETTTPTNKRAFLQHVSGRFYVRPLGAREYGSFAREVGGGFELVWVGADGLPYPCGRSFRKNEWGVLETYLSNGIIRLYDQDVSNDDLNVVADNARRQLMEQGW